MSDIAKRDQNYIPAIQGVSSVDGLSPTDVWVNPVTHALLIDSSSVYPGLDSRYLKLDTSNGPLTGNLLFSDAQKIIGGTATTADLTLQTTSGVGATGADMHFLVGNNGATEALTILNNGNVGIGTPSPTSLLNVATADSTIRVGTTTAASITPALDAVNGAGYGLIMANAVTDVTTKASSIGVRHYTNSEEPMALIRGSASSGVNAVTIGGGSSLFNAATQIDFYTAANSTTVTGTSRMTILAAGNVGIGTAAPTSTTLLHILDNDTSAFPQLKIEQAGTGDATLHFNLTSAANWTVGVDNSDSDSFKISNNGSLGTNDRLTILTGGNVGIGTASPGYKLEVNLGAGSGQSVVGQFYKTAETNAFLQCANFVTSTTGGGFLQTAFARGSKASPSVVVNGDRLGGFFFSGYDGDEFINGAGIFAYADAAVSNDTVPTSLKIETGYGTRVERLSISSGGTVIFNETGIDADLRIEGDTDANLLYIDAGTDRVGIGTSSPSAKLDVNSDTMRLRTAKTPATSGAAGNAGDICWDADYIYVCTATNTWERAAIAAW